MITLSRPFNYGNINDLMYNIVNTPPTDIQDDGLYSKDLIDLVNDMLNKSSAKRPSIKDVCSAIDNIMNNYTKDDNTINNEADYISPISKCGSSNGITLLNVLNSKLINFFKSSKKANSVQSQSPKKTASNNSISLISIFSGQNANSKLNFNSKLFNNCPNNKQFNDVNNLNNINQNTIVNHHNNHFDSCKSIKNYIKLITQKIPVRNQSVPRRVNKHVVKTSKTFEIKKKKTEDLQKKINYSFLLKENRNTNGNYGSQENKKLLIRNILEEKYGKEMLIKIENCTQQDIAQLSDLLGEDEYLKNEKNSKYLLSNS